MGVVPDEDFASFEEALPLSTQELMEIMVGRNSRIAYLTIY